jgi:hypothetical protein
MTGTICQKNPYWLVADDDPGMRIPASCMSYRCSICRDKKIRQRVRIAAYGASKADRLRLLTLTKVPEDWQHARAQLRDYVRRVRKAYSLEIAWALELNPKGTGVHAHALSHGEFIPTDRLREMWGGRFVDMRMASHHASGYMGKCLTMAGYASKSMADHLALNGGRAIHMSRGYLHGLTARQALKAMSSGKKWHLERATREEWRATAGGDDDSRQTVDVDEFGEIV